MLKATAAAYRRAKSLRRAMSLPEILLWRQLRRGQTGRHWRKQHPAGRYILDFYCDSAKLCVETDSEAHERGDRPARDATRDTWLANAGIATLRFAASDILSNLEGVVRLIVETANARAGPPLHHAPRGPPPPMGED